MRARTFLFPMSVALFVALACLISAPAAHAETIDIVFTGLDLTYATPDLSDATATAGRNLNPSESDPLTSVTFSRENSTLIDTSSVYADILLQDVSGISQSGGLDKSSNGNSFGIDVFSTDGTPWSLQLNLNQLNVVYVGPGVAIIALGKISSVQGTPTLPPGLPPIDLTKDIQVSIVSGSLSNPQTSGGVLTGFTASNGVGTISAVLVPEPSALLALLSGALVLAGYMWRRKRR
jgi:hypothetical protein